MKRLSFTALLMSVLSIVCYAQDEIPKIKITHGPYLQNVSDTEATIVWLTDKPSVGWVELAADGNGSFYAEEHPRHFDTVNGVKRTSTVHAVKLSGLAPGTRYRYRIFSQEVLKHSWHKIVYGDYASTDVYSRKPLAFRTRDPQAATASFAVLNDIHANNELLTDLIGHCDLSKTDFVIYNGDMVSVSKSEELLFKGFIDTSVKLFASEIPMYYTRGNHETRGEFATEVQNYLSPREPHFYYTFRQGPVFFVVLDTGEDKPDSDIEYSGITDYDNYRTEQAQWLAGVLESSEYKEAPFKVIIAHIPPAANGTDGGSDEDWHGNVEVEKKFMPLLRKAHPDLMLCGHLHYFVHHKPDARTSFPVIVNANTSVLKAQATAKSLQVEIIGQDGKTIDKFCIEK